MPPIPTNPATTMDTAQRGEIVTAALRVTRLGINPPAVANYVQQELQAWADPTGFGKALSPSGPLMALVRDINREWERQQRQRIEQAAQNAY